jgi:hypothetical protein
VWHSNHLRAHLSANLGGLTHGKLKLRFRVRPACVYLPFFSFFLLQTSGPHTSVATLVMEASASPTPSARPIRAKRSKPLVVDDGTKAPFSPVLLLERPLACGHANELLYKSSNKDFLLYLQARTSQDYSKSCSCQRKTAVSVGVPQLRFPIERD